MTASLPLFEKFDSATTRIKLKPKKMFYRQGDTPAGLYLIESGYVKLYRGSRKKTQILALLGEGETFGAESFFDDAPCPWTAEAITSCEALALGLDDLRKILADHPDMLAELLELVWQRLHQFTDLVHGLAFRDVRARVAEVLLKLAALESHTSDEGICIHRVLSQTELASMAGTAREVVNRTLKKFEQDNVIVVRPDEILVLDIELLEQIAAEEVR